jgi:hypothetical protein
VVFRQLIAVRDASVAVAGAGTLRVRHVVVRAKEMRGVAAAMLLSIADLPDVADVAHPPAANNSPHTKLVAATEGSRARST